MSAATQQHQPARLKFTDHLMFNAVLTENEDLCRSLIGEVLGKHVESIEYLNDEVTFQPDIDGHGARIDVLALIDGEYVDVEMQAGREPSIARRCRFYHSAIATRHMPKGSDYKAVPSSYIIFICLNDPLGNGLPRYELATCCTNNPATAIDDGAVSVLLNAHAWEQEKNPEVAGMLHYALTGRFDGGLAESLAKAVDDKNLDRKWVRASMGVMSYEHEIRVLNHELEDVNAEIEQKKDELEQMAAKLDSVNAENETLKCVLRRLASEGQVDLDSIPLDDSGLVELLLKKDESS